MLASDYSTIFSGLPRPLGASYMKLMLLFQTWLVRVIHPASPLRTHAA